MPDVYYPGIAAGDAASITETGIVSAIVTPNTTYQVFELDDSARATPLPIKTPSGLERFDVPVGALPIFPDVYVVSPNFAHLWKSGELEFRRDSNDAKDKAVAEAVAAAQGALAAVPAEIQRVVESGDFKGDTGLPGRDGSNVLPTDQAIAQAITTPGTPANTALSATTAEIVPPLVANAIGANGAVAAAAAAAVTNALVQKNLSITLVERPTSGEPISTPLTVFSGTPAYNAGKFGNAIKGATLLAPSTITDQTGYYTTEFWFQLATPPGFNKVLLDEPGYYLGLGAAGQLYITDPATVTGPNICDGAWHHIAFVMYRAAATSSRVDGVWVDGTRVIAPTTTRAQVAWYRFALGGFSAAAGSEARNVTFDDLRVSFGAAPRYSTTTFAVPTTVATLDDSTILLASLGSLDASKPGAPGAMGYDPRPTTAPAGMVTYIGLTTPSDRQLRDRWIKA